MKLKYFSMFSGIGGIELGIIQAYENIQNLLHSKERQSKTKNTARVGQGGMGVNGTSGLGCVGYSEVDKYAIQIYEKHFKGHKNYGDATKISAKSIPDFDLLVGGFPCQSFSVAGKRRGFQDIRGTLFFDIARIVKQKQPRLLLLENVKGLLNHEKGQTFAVIIRTLDELGYDLQWQVLNSKDFGVPQNRERVFIIGHLRGTPRPEVFPFSGTVGESKKNVVSTAIDANYWKGADKHAQRTMIVDISYPSRVRKYTNNAPTVRDYGSGGNKMPIVEGIRRLTPLECERLQGFPDYWTATGHEKEDEKGFSKVVEMSDTQRYKTLGNAVTVNVIRAIMEKML